MEGVRHFVISRFNLRLYGKDRNKVPTGTDAWLSGRFELFETYCLPSMRAQTCRDFVWLCLLDDQTPQSYRDRMEAYRAECPMLRPLYYSAGQVESLTENLRRDILALAGPGATHILTTNLDNDDALERRAVETLQRELRPSGDKSAYAFRVGYQYFTGMRYALKLRLANNHFLSLLEPAGPDLETIVSFRHARVAKCFPVHYVGGDEPMWLEIVHQHNVSNNLRIYNKARNIPVLRPLSLAGFGVNLHLNAGRQAAITFFVMPFKFIATGYGRLKGKAQRRRDSKSVRCETTDFL